VEVEAEVEAKVEVEAEVEVEALQPWVVWLLAVWPLAV
jgi:hypothetical protein